MSLVKHPQQGDEGGGGGRGVGGSLRRKICFVHSFPHQPFEVGADVGGVRAPVPIMASHSRDDTTKNAAQCFGCG